MILNADQDVCPKISHPAFVKVESWKLEEDENGPVSLAFLLSENHEAPSLGQPHLLYTRANPKPRPLVKADSGRPESLRPEGAFSRERALPSVRWKVILRGPKIT